MEPCIPLANEPEAVYSLLDKVSNPHSVALDAMHDKLVRFDLLRVLILLHQWQMEHPGCEELPLLSPICFEGHAMEPAGANPFPIICGVCRHQKPVHCRMSTCKTCAFELCYTCQRAIKEHMATTPLPLLERIDEVSSLRVRRALLASMIQQRLGRVEEFDRGSIVGHDYAIRFMDRALLNYRTMLALIRADQALLPHGLIVTLCNAALAPPSSSHSKSYFKDLPMELLRLLFDMLGAQAAWFPVLEDRHYY